MVVFNGDESKTVVDGVKVKPDGTLENVKVDERYAAAHQVWVVGFNERESADTRPALVHSDVLFGEQQVAYMQGAEAETRSTAQYTCPGKRSCDGLKTQWSDAYIHSMQVNCLKETWLAGKAEVSVVAFSTFPNKKYPDTGKPHDAQWVGDGNYRVIKKMARGFLNKCFRPYELSTNIYPKWLPTIDNDPGTPDGNLLFFAIFERDPTGSRKVKLAEPFIDVSFDGTIRRGSTVLEFRYDSEDSFYAAGVMDSDPEPHCTGLLCKMNHPCNYVINNGCLKMTFNTSP